MHERTVETFTIALCGLAGGIDARISSPHPFGIKQTNAHFYDCLSFDGPLLYGFGVCCTKA